MPTYIATGKDLTLTVDGNAVSPQASSVELTYENKVNTYEVLTGMVKKVVGTDGTLAVSLFQDWGAGTSFCEALWDAAAAGDAVTFTFNADGSTFTGSVIPQFPNVGGAADAALESKISFPISGTVSRA
jgi:hypothetical protein